MKLQQDPNDKRAHREVDFHANEKHTEDEIDAEHDAKLNDWHSRHSDKLLDIYCDTHPDSPECRVYDDWRRVSFAQRDLQASVPPDRPSTHPEGA